jgi:hypothetical protein
MASVMYYTDEQIAIVCHETIRGIQLALNEPAPSPGWEVQDPALRVLMLGSVQAVRRQGAGPAEIHELWENGMRELGYGHGDRRLHGTSNPTHPSVGVSFNDLPRDERLKDELTVLITSFMATVQR